MSPVRVGAILLAGVLSASLVHGDPRQLGARPADAWVKLLDSPQRVAGLKIDEVVARLNIRPGSTVADIGAGAGAWEGALSGAVSPGGTVYAVDIDQGLLDHIAARATQVGLTNVRVVLGKFTDPALPVRNIDVALIYDVLHHIESRAEYLKSLASYVGPDGRIAIVDFIPGRGGHVDDLTQQVSKDQVAAWMAAAGFKPAEEIALFDDKWFVIYSR